MVCWGVGGGVDCVVAIDVDAGSGCVGLVGGSRVGKRIVVCVGFSGTWVWCHQRLLKFPR